MNASRILLGGRYHDKWRKVWHPLCRKEGRPFGYMLPRGETRELKKQAQLQRFEKRMSDGESFVPEALLPPWKRQIRPAGETKTVVKLGSLRVRSVNQQSGPPFATHFQ